MKGFWCEPGAPLKGEKTKEGKKDEKDARIVYYSTEMGNI